MKELLKTSQQYLQQIELNINIEKSKMINITTVYKLKTIFIQDFKLQVTF